MSRTGYCKALSMQTLVIRVFYSLPVVTKSRALLAAIEATG
jgi:hypothetical protein